MQSTSTSLERLLRQESLLQFDSFSNEAALGIGLKLVELARAEGKTVTVDIRRNGNLLFAHAMNGAPADHADWIRRKNNLVNRTGHSSHYIHTEVRENGGDIDALPTFEQREFAAHGGAFPVVVRGTGQVGTITVSGLPGPEDHALVVRALKDYLKVDADI